MSTPLEQAKNLIRKVIEDIREKKNPPTNWVGTMTDYINELNLDDLMTLKKYVNSFSASGYSENVQNKIIDAKFKITGEPKGLISKRQDIIAEEIKSSKKSESKKSESKKSPKKSSKKTYYYYF